MRLNLRRWLIVVLGAGLPIPYALHLRGDSSNYVAVDLLLWPIVAGTLVITSREKWWLLYRDAVGALLLTFVVISAVSVPIGYLVFRSSSGVLSFGYELLILSNFAVGFAALRRDEDLDLLVRSFVISLGTIASALSIYLLAVGEIGRVHVVHNSPALRALIYGWPNGFAVLVVVGLVMGLYLVSKSSTRGSRILYGALVGGLGLCLLLTVSKTGWVVAALAAWLLWIRFWSVGRQLALLAVIAIGGLVLYFAGNESIRMQIFTLDTLTERLKFLILVVRDVNPLVLLFGSGSQNVETVMAAHSSEILVPHVTVGSLSTHDEFLSTLIKTGIFGLIVYVAALGTAMWRSWRLAAGDASSGRLFRYWFAASAGVMVSLFAGEELRYWLVSALFWLMAGAAAHRVAAGATLDERRGDEIKRVLDVIAATLGLIALSPVIAIAALAVRLDSPGPVIYAGERVGLHGRVFRMYKLRTMHTGSDAHGSVTIAHDSRVTRVGRLLRRLKVDEIPQFANVLVGDMSLVGPRPDTPEYVRLYDDRQRSLLRVRPGITSPATVEFHNEEELIVAAAHDSGRTPTEVYREVIMPREIEIDLEYVEHRSLHTDLRVLLQTAGLIFMRLRASSGEARHAHGRSASPSQSKIDKPL